ncbi:hypothetical protein H5410_004198 [Solanum commersonii]|uniref:Uncharacterized protein n=1 Tax=Solanum commersonii TaxID=4109 RepID=A0A9J6B732_SOLCO|nr:hypothetical protein H5410_004198 [Solanum commersonii]
MSNHTIQILFSRTLFQNNIKELFNTLSIVNPKFAAGSEQWASLSKHRDIISPLVHTFNEDIKKVILPAIKNSVIYLEPTDLQELLKRIPKNPGSHLKRNLFEFSELESQFSERRYQLDPDIGVRMKFIVELIKQCDGPKERVIIFS